MIRLKEYIKHNSLQSKANIQCLQEYDKDAAWRFNCGSAVDIGCGDGSFTSKVLKHFLPENCKIIIGCDNNEEMIQYANENYRSERVTFEVLDISETLPKEDYNKFNQAFSFFAIHWPRAQRKVFQNIFNLLTPGGGCFLVFLGKLPCFFETYRILFNTTKWRPWMFDTENTISPYHDSVDPVAEIEEMMIDIGFTEINVSYRKTTYTYIDIEDFQASVQAVNNFPIPEDNIKEYLNDFAKIARENGFINDDYAIEYYLLIVRGKKT